jgi:hypothetical protein
MDTNVFKSSLIKFGLAASMLLLASGSSLADTVNLTAAPTQAVLQDGQTVPMWGYSCGAVVGTATCAASNPNAGVNWSPVVITIPSGTPLTINLTNNLSFPNSNTVPTSLVIVGQLGGGLGTDRLRCRARRTRRKAQPGPAPRVPRVPAAMKAPSARQLRRRA